MRLMPQQRFDEAPAAMRRAACEFQSRFGIAFRTLTYFSEHTLHALHKANGDDDEMLGSVLIASKDDEGILERMARLRHVANLPKPALADRLEYYDALREIYRRIVVGVPAAERIIVAPEREGRILAQSLGMLRDGVDLAPHAKRIPFQHGLLVGVSACSPAKRAQGLLFFDGAIASGATLISLIDLLAEPGVPVVICSVHAAREGLRAILRHAAQANLDVRIHVGHVTEGLSPKFYAVGTSASDLIVGDLGDTIAPVAAAPEA